MNDRVPDGDDTGRDDPGSEEAARDDSARDDSAREEADTDAEESPGAIHVATEGEEWRFSADDLEGRDDLEPGTPNLENVVFVLVGVLFALAVIAQFAI